MLIISGLGFTSVVLLVAVVIGVVFIRRKWRQSVARSEEVNRLLASVAEESARVEFEASEEYYCYYTGIDTAGDASSARASVSTPAPIPIPIPIATPAYSSVPLSSQYQCAVCFCPTTTRCAKCKAVRYCSGKCQIVHWRQGHKDECRPYVPASPINNAGVTFETVKSTHQTSVNPSRQSTGTSSSLFSTDDDSNESSLSEPSTDSRDDANGHMAKHTTKFVSNSNIMNEFSVDKLSVTGLGTEKFNDYIDSSNNMVHDGSRRSAHGDMGVGSDPTSNLREFKKSTFKDDKTFGILSSSEPGKSNDVLSNKITSPGVTKAREVVSTSRHMSHSTKPVKVDIDNKTSKKSQSVLSGLKTPKFKVVEHLKPTKLARQVSLEGECDTSHKYSFKGLFPYEMFVKLYNWKQVELQPFGLQNCGNSCYANAVLQCLLYTPPLTAYLLEGFHSKRCVKRGWCLTCELQGLVMQAKYVNSPVSPVRILSHIENIGSNLGQGKEEDAHEFLRYAIESLQSVCIKEARTKLNSSEEETTLIGLTFGGYLRSKIMCMKCGGKSEQRERMMDLTVEIDGDITTLKDALDKFTCTEILDGENKYKCNMCKLYVKAKKKLTLLEAPNVLTIALKRFQSGKYGKINKSIHFPEILDMTSYVNGKSDKHPIYRLYGVVVHVDTMNDAFSGHYISYVKNIQNRWFKFDDSMVNEVDLQHVLTKGAYMLLYARCSPRAPRSIRSSLTDYNDPRKDEIPPPFASKPHTSEPWDTYNYHPQVHHRSLEEESYSSDNSGFFSESCSCSSESINLNSSDSDTSSTASSPLYSRLSHLYTSSTTNGGSCVCRNLDCSCNCCTRVTNLDRLDGSSVTFRRSLTRRKNDLKY
ncbi:ubiquitin carboxyl-terminal hydrolase 17-like isoform X1 [Bidens hawaiensis]|uniref:ubiquitin carboxyl-terminal hydrolase 17-like isoform X1 n=1 Tax=Bidens hawaiensis TaxID=980011 RepID=UPI0040498CE8